MGDHWPSVRWRWWLAAVGSVAASSLLGTLVIYLEVWEEPLSDVVFVAGSLGAFVGTTLWARRWRGAIALAPLLHAFVYMASMAADLPLRPPGQHVVIAPMVGLLGLAWCGVASELLHRLDVREQRRYQVGHVG